MRKYKNPPQLTEDLSFSDAYKKLSKDSENKELALFILKNFPNLFSIVGENLNKDHDFLKKVLYLNPNAFDDFTRISSDIKSKEEYLDVMLEAVKIKSLHIRNINKELLMQDSILEQFLDVNINIYSDIMNGNSELSANAKRIDNLTFNYNHLKRFIQNPVRYYHCLITYNQKNLYLY
jgi:hypothetical protein